MSVVLITHDLGVVAEVATHVVVMYAGRVVESAPVRRLFSHPRHPYTRGLLRSLPSFEKVSLMAPLLEEQAHEANEAPRRPRLPVIDGLVPDLAALPPGCRFADRCPLVMDACRAREPELATVAADASARHLARCIRASEI